MACWISFPWQLGELVGTVSSRRLTDESSIRMMLGLARVVLMLVRIVAGGESEVLHVRMSLDSSGQLLMDTGEKAVQD